MPLRDPSIARLFLKNKKHSLTVPIHGIRLRFWCDQKPLLEDIREYLDYFAGRPKARTEEVTHCSMTILPLADYRAIQKRYRPQKRFEAFPGVEATFGILQDLSVYEIKSSCLIMIDNHSNDCACVLRRSADKKLIHTDMIIHILLIEWLRGMGLFFIHASGISRNKSAYLFVGPSGAGKTTSALMGIQRGLSFMGDDLLIAKEKRSAISVHSYIEDVKFCLDMADRFQELEKSKPVREAAKKRKKATKLNIKDFFEVTVADHASVRRIYFLNRGRSLRKLKPQEALPLLMNNSFFYSREDTSIRHFEILCRLVYSVESFVVGRGYLNRHFETLLAE